MAGIGHHQLYFVLRIIRYYPFEPAQVHAVHVDDQVKAVIIGTCYLASGFALVKWYAVRIQAAFGWGIDGVTNLLS